MIPLTRHTLPCLALALSLAIIHAPVTAQVRSDTIVVLAGAPLHPGMALVATELTIGSLDGAEEYLFDDIANVLVAADGTVWVLDAPVYGDAQLRQYDAAGRYVRTVGRTGGGPGEFTSPGGPAGLAQLPDGRVLLRDLRANRINVYTPDGRADTTWVFPTRYAWAARGRDPLTVDTLGLTWMPFSVRRDRDADPWFGFVRLRADGSVVDTVPVPDMPEVPRASITITSNDGRSVVELGPPFQPLAGWWWSRNGHLITANTSRYAVDLLVPPEPTTPEPAGSSAAESTAPTWSPGDPVISIRRNVPPVRVADGERREHHAVLDWDVNQREGDRSGPIPEVPRTKPAFTAIMTAQDGRLWVRVTMPSEPLDAEPSEAEPDPRPGPAVNWREPAALDVFEADGVYVGRIALPESTFPVWIDGDVVWARFRDALGVNFVKKLRVEWR